MRRFSYLIIGLLVLAGLSLVGYNLAGHKKSAPSTVPETTNTSTGSQATNACPVVEKASVKITDQGFEPSQVCVVQGGTVTWTNTSSSAHRVASDPHPTHTDYPGFDDTGGERAGTTYSFTFTRIGSWGYHDHQDPTLTGKVVVTAR